MDDLDSMLNSAPGSPAHMDPASMTRRADRIRRRLYGPFVVVVVALALWALSRAASVAPSALQPIIDKVPDGLGKNVLIWLRDVSVPVAHYTSKLFVWMEPAARAIFDWFVKTASELGQRFLDWVESL